ncbi:formyltetrahydrofolate deformylase [Robertmurraya sp. FSL R5-0851]|uniref:formyltetrahydrofolate deformylase n=1 Tax=Robertmurraya sp. FSL R5-0851 TaxID=2921584 RepID=UPI00136F5E35
MQHDIKEKRNNRGILLISCPDRPGIVSKVSTTLFNHDCNIIDSNQHSTDPEAGHFFLRIEFECSDLEHKKSSIEKSFQLLSEIFDMKYSFNYGNESQNLAIFVSKENHCLLELLLEWQRGDLLGDIKLVIGNHEDLKEYVENVNIPFYYLPITRETKEEVEKKQLELLKEYEIDTIVLARYMQILSPSFIEHYPCQIINIHHSFLPAFVGANPYKRAYERGVKLIGATAHYVTDDLDEGPIIEQDIERVKHHHELSDLKKIGSQVERKVLLKAVKWHNSHRIIPFGNKTIVFD